MPTTDTPRNTKRYSAPAYQRIEEDLRRRIRSGQWAPGYQIPGRRELAKHYDVEVNTLQRALVELVEDGTLRAEKRKGTFVAGDAALYQSTNTDIHDQPAAEMSPIAMPARFVLLAGVTPKRELPTSNELWSRRASSSFERVVQGRGHSTHTVNLMDRDVADTARDIDASLVPGADVIAYFYDGSLSIEEVARLDRHVEALFRDERYRNTRLVRISWGQILQFHADTVTFDGGHGSYIATEYLLGLGHRDIVFASAHQGQVQSPQSWLRDRIAGFYRALFAGGYEWAGPDRDPMNADAWSRVVYADPASPGQEMWYEAGRSCWKRLKERGKLPTAVVAANDQFAYSLVEEARADGVDIPAQMSVIGYDDRYCSSAMNLTTIHVPVEELGVAAADLAMERLLSGSIAEPVKNIILKPTLVVRSTTGPVSQQ